MHIMTVTVCRSWANMDVIHRNVDTNMEVKNRKIISENELKIKLSGATGNTLHPDSLKRHKLFLTCGSFSQQAPTLSRWS